MKEIMKNLKNYIDKEISNYWIKNSKNTINVFKKSIYLK